MNSCFVAESQPLLWQGASCAEKDVGIWSNGVYTARVPWATKFACVMRWSLHLRACASRPQQGQGLEGGQADGHALGVLFDKRLIC